MLRNWKVNLTVLALASGMLLWSVPVFAETGCVTVFGLEHCPLGQATLQVDSAGRLVISNIGSSGEDGVTIYLPPNLKLFNVHTLPLGDPSDPGNPIPDGAFVEIITRGTVSGIPDQVISVIHCEDTGSAVLATIDFSTVEPESLRADFSCEGSATFSCFWPWVKKVAAKIWPDSWDPTLTDVGDVSVPDITLDWNIGSCHPVITPEGDTISTDLLEVTALDPANPVSGYSRMTLTAKDIPTITIYNEKLVTTSPIPTLTEWGMIIFGVLLLGFISWVFLRRRKAAVSLR